MATAIGGSEPQPVLPLIEVSPGRAEASGLLGGEMGQAAEAAEAFDGRSTSQRSGSNG